MAQVKHDFIAQAILTCTEPEQICMSMMLAVAEVDVPSRIERTNVFHSHFGQPQELQARI